MIDTVQDALRYANLPAELRMTYDRWTRLDETGKREIEMEITYSTLTSRNAVSIPDLAQRLITLKTLRANVNSKNIITKTDQGVYTRELEKLKRYLGAFDLGVMWDDTNETFVVYALDATKD